MWLCGLAVETMQSVEFGALEVTLKNSLISHLQVQTGINAARQFGKEDVVPYYNSLLVYENMTLRQNTTRVNGDAFVQMEQETLFKWASWTPEKVKIRKGKKHRVCIGPGIFCAIGYINDVVYLRGDAAQITERD